MSRETFDWDEHSRNEHAKILSMYQKARETLKSEGYLVFINHHNTHDYVQISQDQFFGKKIEMVGQAASIIIGFAAALEVLK
jgi:hypothetical protein